MNDDPHAPYVLELAQAGDWAGLVRYAIAHGFHRPAIDTAIEIVRARSGEPWPTLAAYLAEFAENAILPREPPEPLLRYEWEQEATITLELVSAFPRMAVCEIASQLPPDELKEVLGIGMQATTFARQSAEATGDCALEAFAGFLLARSYQEARQFETAEVSFQEALGQYHRLAQSRPDVYLPSVATTLYNLGLVRRALSRLEDAEASYQEALDIRRRLAHSRPDVHLSEVAMTLCSLGLVQRDLGRLADAEASYEEALDQYRRLAHSRPDGHRSAVAMALNNLGLVQRDLGRLADAEASYEEALDQYRRLAHSRPDDHLPSVATALHNLGLVQRPLGRLKDAEANYREALEIRRRLAVSRPDLHLADVAITLNALGNVQSDLSWLEDAEASHQEALAIRRTLARSRPEVYLPSVATTLYNLGNVQRVLSRLADAEASYQEALRLRRAMAGSRPEAYLPDVAVTLNNLGLVQRDLSRLEDAEASYQEALGIRQRLASNHPETYLSDAAMTLTNLGSVQNDLNRPEDAEASHQGALGHYRRLAQSRPEVYLPSVAATLNNLALVQRVLNHLSGAEESCQEALGHYRRLAQSRPEVYLPSVAITLNNLGFVQRNLSRLEDAETSHQEALAIRRTLARSRPEVYMTDVAVTLNNLGNVQSDLGRLADAEASYREARQAYDCLRESIGDGQLMERQALYHNYARLLLREEPRLAWPDRPRARELLGKAITHGERFRGLFGDPRKRIRVQGELLEVFRQQVLLCLKIGYLRDDASAFREALETAEASRSRALLDSLTPVHVPVATPPELREEFVRLRGELRRAQRRAHQEYETLQAIPKLEAPTQSQPSIAADERGDSTEGGSTRAVQVRRLRCSILLTQQLSVVRDQEQRFRQLQMYIGERLPRYRETCARLTEIEPTFDPNASAMSFRLQNRGELFPIDRRTVYLHLEILEEDCHAFVISRERLIPIPLKSLTCDLLFEHINALIAAQRTPSSTSAMIAAMDRALAEVTRTLRTHLVEPLLPVLAEAGLQPGDRLILVPDGAMNFLPLHAVPVGEGETLADRYEVSYTPSLSVLLQCLRRKVPEPTRLAVAVNPLGDLHYAEAEAKLVQVRFAEVAPCHGQEVTLSKFFEIARDCHVCHWTGHALFDISIPNWSGLVVGRSGPNGEVVAPDDLITLTDIDCGLEMTGCRLAVISGCQSGLALAGSGNEYVSLVGAFLNAGAKAVLASLWPVEDRACMLTIDRFFHEWRDQKKGIAAALKAAQRWLRELTVAELSDHLGEIKERAAKARILNTLGISLDRLPLTHGDSHRPFASPYYWAPFVAVGQTWADENGA